MMLHGQELSEFDKIQSQYGGAASNHLKLIQEGLLEYLFSINALSKKKLAMRRTMRKPRSMSFKHFAARLTEINNFLTLFPGSDASKKMEMEELNKILLHVVPNGWAKQSYLQGWYFGLNTYGETCEMFYFMEVAEQVYEGGTPSKMPIRAVANHDGHIWKRKRVEAVSPTNPEKGRYGKAGKKCNPSKRCAYWSKKYMLVSWPRKLFRRL